MKTTFLASLLLLFFVGAQAQDRFDSLKQYLDKTLPDSVYFKALNDLSFQYAFVNPDSNKHYAHRYITAAQDAQNLKEESNGWSNLAVGYAVSGESLDSSIALFERSLKIRLSVPNVTNERIADSYNNLGQAYFLKGDYTNAVKYYELARPIQEKYSNLQGLAHVYANLGLVYKFQGNVVKSLERYQQALDIETKRGDRVSMAGTLSMMANLEKSESNPEVAMRHYRQAEKVFDSLGNYPKLSEIYLGIAEIHKGYKDYDSAKYYCRKSYLLHDEPFSYLEMSEICKIQNQPDSVRYYVEMALKMTEGNDRHTRALRTVLVIAAGLDMDEGKWQEALPRAQRAYKLAKETDDFQNIQNAARILAQIYAIKEEYKEAFNYQKIYHQVKDSLFNAENIKAFTRLESEYAFEKERQQSESEKMLLKEEQAKQRTFLLAALALLGAALLVAFLFYRQQRIKTKANQLLGEKNEEIRQQAEELRQTNEKLIQLDQFKESMTGMIVHDLKNPLNTILGRTRNLSTSKDGQYIAQAGQRMLNLVMNILDVQKFENTQVNPQKQNISFQEIVLHASEQVDMLIEEKNITLHQDFDQTLGLNADPALAERVLVNLLTNAVKFTPNNGQITITAAPADEQGKQIKISVRDTGIGIPEDKMEAIFQRFGQASAQNLGVTGSTGLGLTFCKLVVEAHGGAIGVSSALGKGSTFWFTLPAGLPVLVTEKAQATSLRDAGMALVLSEQERDQLRPVCQELQAFEVYEASRIERVVQEFDFLRSENLKQWKEKLDQALFACNDELYKDLLKLS